MSSDFNQLPTSCSLKKCISKLLFQKAHFNIAPSKLLPQKMHFKKHISKLLPQKMHFKITITKIVFISASINAVKGKIDINKSLIMYGPILAIHYSAFIIIIKIQS